MLSPERQEVMTGNFFRAIAAVHHSDGKKCKDGAVA